MEYKQVTNLYDLK